MTRILARRLVQLAATATLVAAWAATGSAQDREGVPLLGGGQENIVLIVSFEEEAVRRLLPDGLEPVEGLTGGIDIFTMGYSWPGGPATVSYIWIDVAGFDAPDGTPGSYVISYHSQDNNLPMADTLGWPNRPGGAELVQDGTTVRGAVIVGDAPIVTVELMEDPESCAPVATEQTYFAPRPDGTLATTFLVWGGLVCDATVSSFTFEVPDGDPLDGLDPQIVVGITEHNVAWALSMPPEPLAD